MLVITHVAYYLTAVYLIYEMHCIRRDLINSIEIQKK